ncbi:MAG: Asp-tRNA(Asn)/Glu-tRNA(Gln) amidotransferase GatCAB subunit B, partial [Clostridiales bacterium]|nr:Asp-tRNA(Asn)/Glu-tRNA(Gln) amidotransferase GatCAB subunit B [Clostridiales bacterium]
IEYGGSIRQETRRWDDGKGTSVSMRGKEEAQDYRYFPDPDLVQIVVDDAMIRRIRAELPELPAARRERYVGEYGLTRYDAEQITNEKPLADFFERCIAAGAPAKTVSNWLIGDISKLLNEKGMEPADLPFAPEHLAKLIAVITQGTISNTAGKKVIDALFENPRDPELIIKEKGLAQISDEGALAQIVAEVIGANPQSVEDYRAGKEKAIGFLVGQTMRATKGQGNPQLLNRLIKEALDGNNTNAE